MKSNSYNDMKTISLLLIISLFINGVFGDEIERVSVNDGGSVTLHTDLTELQRDDVIMWWFNGDLIAKINRAVGVNPDYDSDDERFRDRLKMNPQTGSLTITDIRSEHTGDYQLEIIRDKTKTKSFSVSLSLKVKTVIIGDSVTLHIDVTDEQRNDQIHWKIKHKNFTVAEIITENGRVTEHVHDERFRGRLKLNDQTGDVIITNLKNNKDSGLYEADVTIGNNTHTIHQTFSFTGSSVSSGVIVGICVSLLVVIAAVIGGVIYRRRRMNRQDSNTGEEATEMQEPLRNGDTGEEAMELPLMER